MLQTDLEDISWLSKIVPKKGKTFNYIGLKIKKNN